MSHSKLLLTNSFMFSSLMASDLLEFLYYSYNVELFNVRVEIEYLVFFIYRWKLGFMLQYVTFAFYM
uniref:Uncharacterized protein n=1 Tax=Gossypium raimondii TaxID=29730 RepID=A0A0D2TRB3_GOSRA|nr:hypothetical protein B456_009G168200 [Gossypium raimondii]